MDGLPVEEKSGLANASKARQVGLDGVEAPVMHACGHDTHITALVATARRLAALKDHRLTADGCVVIKGQEHRSQDMNREEARQRLDELVNRAAHVPKARRPTRPSRAAKKRRVESKVLRGRVKSLRGKVTEN